MKRFLNRFTAIFTLGILLGSSLTSVLIGRQIDALYIENRSFRENMAAAEQQIKKLQEKQPDKKRVISNINTYVSFSSATDYTDTEQRIIELIVGDHIREKLEVLAGQNIDDVNYLLVPRIIDQREIDFENQKLRLVVNLVIISETVSVYVEVTPTQAIKGTVIPIENLILDRDNRPLDRFQLYHYFI